MSRKDLESASVNRTALQRQGIKGWPCGMEVAFHPKRSAKSRGGPNQQTMLKPTGKRKTARTINLPYDTELARLTWNVGGMHCARWSRIESAGPNRTEEAFRYRSANWTSWVSK